MSYPSENTLSSKQIMIDKKHIQENSNMHRFISEKSTYISEIIRNTILSIKHNKNHGIFSHNDVNLSINILTELYDNLRKIDKALIETDPNAYDQLLDQLQHVIDKLSNILCNFGTDRISDMLFVCFGSDFAAIHHNNKIRNDKFQLIAKHVHPIGYKLINWKNNKIDPSFNSPDDPIDNVDKTTDDTIQFETMPTFECVDVERNIKSFYQQVHGIRIIVQNPKLRKTLIILGVLDDIHLECISNEFINHHINTLNSLVETYTSTERSIFSKIIETLTLKDLLIYSKKDIQYRVISVLAEVNNLKHTQIDSMATKFLDNDLFSQRQILINLLTYPREDDIHFSCYVLYDLIQSSSNNNDQNLTVLFDSFPWKIKMQMKDCVKNNLKTTHTLTQKNITNKLTLEQQVYLLKVSDAVKAKAILKIKDIQGKPDEMVLKTKQYLEGLVRIPFGIYKEEGALTTMKHTNDTFIQLRNGVLNMFPQFFCKMKTKYTTTEIIKCLNDLRRIMPLEILSTIRINMQSDTVKNINIIAIYIHACKHNTNGPLPRLAYKSKQNRINQIIEYLNANYQEHENYILSLFYSYNQRDVAIIKSITNNITQVNDGLCKTTRYIDSITTELDRSIHGHSHAKNQILKVFGQWINGVQSGYCFGFEGSPGIGKTSLAKKGLTNCLVDDNGDTRPFAFIALGGSCNGSTLEGHGYTYVNSTWGKIVDILMETKCMNPIIYIDELDKVSKTEQGNEIIGILTHLIDPTQNSSFQDKYFSGIDIDLSKVLFIFSYNDPAQIDKILLDRIHRIKFDNLTIEEKKVIVHKYILPEINTKMGFENVIELTDELIEYIILNYTMEPGVRKLKEIMFDLYGEINLEIMRNKTPIVIPIIITIDDIDNKYLSKYNKFLQKKIHTDSKIGIINGLWANSLGDGGITPIQTQLYPSTAFLELHLTGLQGDVMKESMSVARTVAWNLTADHVKNTWLKHSTDTKCQGLHIHCPEGSISKDGPSAGTAIATAIYSLFNNKYIKPDVAITGEITLCGEITAIGGLDIKINNGIRAGIKTFLFPVANDRDFSKWKNENHSKIPANIHFIPVSHISQVFTHVFDNNRI